MGMAQLSMAADAYQIHLKMPDTNDTMIFLLHYYGKNRPTLFKVDSARIDKRGNAEFKGKDPDFVGGIYVMLLSNRTCDFEFLLNKGDNISMNVKTSKITVDDAEKKTKIEALKVDKITFSNSPENERFEEYVDFLKEYAETEKKFENQLKQAKTADDTAAVRKEAIAYSKKLTNYRRTYEKAHPGTLLANIFNAMEIPEVPEGPHYLEDGKTKDSTFAYHYYKSHYWDGFNFQDDRLIYTPIYDSRLEEYMEKLVVSWPDSVEHESDILLAKAKGTKDVFHYTLWWLTRYVENSKVMGMDEAFVYLVENYYMKGDAFWLTNDELKKYAERAQAIAPNVIGNIAPEIVLPNVITKKQEDMLAEKAKYTLLVFYSPTCGHCQKELPELDSLYRAVLKAKGVKVYTVATEGEEKTITDFLNKDKLTDWTNTWNPDHTSDYHNKYDVYSTPTIYLLDEKKIIRGKRLDHSNLSGLIDMLEKREKEKAKEKNSGKTNQ